MMEIDRIIVTESGGAVGVGCEELTDGPAIGLAVKSRLDGEIKAVLLSPKEALEISKWLAAEVQVAGRNAVETAGGIVEVDGKVVR